MYILKRNAGSDKEAAVWDTSGQVKTLKEVSKIK